MLGIILSLPYPKLPGCAQRLNVESSIKQRGKKQQQEIIGWVEGIAKVTATKQLTANINTGLDILKL